MRFALAIMVCCLLAACSITAPRDVGKANMFSLSATDGIRASHTSPATLKINYPVAPSELDTYRIAVTMKDGRQDYYASARWSEFLPSLLQTALHESLSHAAAYRYVEKDEGGAAGKYILNTDIDDCRAVYVKAGQPPQVIIRLSFRLISPQNKALRTFTTEARVNAKANTLLSIAEAFNDAYASNVTQLLKKLRIK